jgi:hypothetical protein
MFLAETLSFPSNTTTAGELPLGIGLLSLSHIEALRRAKLSPVARIQIYHPK